MVITSLLRDDAGIISDETAMLLHQVIEPSICEEDEDMG